MQKQVLKQAVINILGQNKSTEDIAEEDETMNTLLNKLIKDSTNCLNEFSSFLEDECCMKPIDIFALAWKLMITPTIKDILGIKISYLWLLFKIFETLGILSDFKHSDQNKKKRRKVEEIFEQYIYIDSNIPNLLKACFKAINYTNHTEQIQVNKIVQIENIFFKECPESEHLLYNLNKNIERKLYDMIDDYKLFPQCSFMKKLQSQIIIAYLHKYQSCKSIIDKELAHFNYCSDIEEMKKKYLEEYKVITLEIKELFEQVNTSKATFSFLCTLKAKIASINILELERIINKTNETKRIIQGKDVLFVIGNTGSGKTTNILKFLGYTLKIAKFRNLNTLIPTKRIRTQHKYFYTSPEARSCTRYINAVPIPDQMYPTGWPKCKKNIVICDSPGFGDTAGVEVDIANEIGMINALRGARAVRILIILSYDSLIRDRMAGTVQICEKISNYFSQLVALNSIAIYFNKVPANKIAELPNYIESKLKNLNSYERSNQRLLQTLNLILDRSHSKENFVDPISSDYKALLSHLIQRPVIQDVQTVFQYSLSNQTRYKIDKCLQAEKNNMLQSFKSKNYNMAQFSLKMINVLNSVLPDNQRIEKQNQSLAQFAKNKIQQQLKKFQELVIEIVNNRQKQNLQNRIIQSKENISELKAYFYDFDQLLITASNQVDEIVQHNKNNLLNKWKIIEEVTCETIHTTKLFCNYIDSNFENQIKLLIDLRFNEIFLCAQKQIKQKRLSQLGHSLKILNNLITIYNQIFHAQESNSFSGKIEKLKANLRKIAEQTLKSISNWSMMRSRLTEYEVNKLNINIEQIQIILSLNFIDKSQKIEQKLLDSIVVINNQCKQIIDQILDIRMNLDQQKTIGIYDLKGKKQKLELLMTIKNVREHLKDDYESFKQRTISHISDNVNSLKKYISNLSSIRNEEIFHKLNFFSIALIAIIQYAELINYCGTGQYVRQQLEQLYIQYLQRELLFLKSISLNLCQINDKKMETIKLQYNRIDCYPKMRLINDKIQSLVAQLKEQLNNKIKEPFLEFNQKDFLKLKAKHHYSHIIYNCQKLERFKRYALKIKDIVSEKDYIKISNCKGKNQLQNRICKQIDIDFNKFISLTLQHQEHPIFLKNLIKTLLIIANKEYFCDFLIKFLDFDVSKKINTIQLKLDEIKDKMDKMVKQSLNDEKRLEKLKEDCKFYAQVEKIYQSKIGQYHEFGFIGLQIKCEGYLRQIEINYEQQIKQMIDQKKPSNISFKNILFYFKKQTKDNWKQLIIVNKLRKVEEEVMKNLDKFRYDINNPVFIENSPKFNDLLDTLIEAKYFYKNIKQLFANKADHNQSEIRQKINKICRKITEAFKNEFNLTFNLLINYSMETVNERLSKLKYLEIIVQEIYDPQQEFDENSLNDLHNINNFIDDKANMLKQQIKNNCFLNEQKIYASHTKLLYKLLQILKKSIENEIKDKGYNGDTPTLDYGYSKYHSSTSQTTQLELNLKIKKYISAKYCRQVSMIKSQSNLMRTYERIQSQISSLILRLPQKIRQQLSRQYSAKIQAKRGLYQLCKLSQQQFKKQLHLRRINNDWSQETDALILCIITEKMQHQQLQESALYQIFSYFKQSYHLLHKTSNKLEIDKLFTRFMQIIERRTNSQLEKVKIDYIKRQNSFKPNLMETIEFISRLSAKEIKIQSNIKKQYQIIFRSQLNNFFINLIKEHKERTNIIQHQFQDFVSYKDNIREAEKLITCISFEINFQQIIGDIVNKSLLWLDSTFKQQWSHISQFSIKSEFQQTVSTIIVNLEEMKLDINKMKNMPESQLKTKLKIWYNQYSFISQKQIRILLRKYNLCKDVTNKMRQIQIKTVEKIRQLIDKCEKQLKSNCFKKKKIKNNLGIQLLQIIKDERLYFLNEYYVLNKLQEFKEWIHNQLKSINKGKKKRKILEIKNVSQIQQINNSVSQNDIQINILDLIKTKKNIQKQLYQNHQQTQQNLQQTQQNLKQPQYNLQQPQQNLQQVQQNLQKPQQNHKKQQIQQKQQQKNSSGFSNSLPIFQKQSKFEQSSNDQINRTDNLSHSDKHIDVSYYEKNWKCQIKKLLPLYFQNCCRLIKSLSKQYKLHLPVFSNINVDKIKRTLKYKMQKGCQYFSNYQKGKTNNKNQSEFIKDLINKNLSLDWIISAAMGIQNLEEIGLFHADFLIRNTIQRMKPIQNKSYTIFKVIDFDYAFQIKSYQGCQDSYNTTIKMLQVLIDLQETERQQYQENIISFIFRTYNQEKRVQTIRKIISILRMQISRSEKIKVMMEALQSHMYESHLCQFTAIVREIVSHPLFQKYPIEIKNKILIEIGQLQKLSRQFNRYQNFAQQLITFKEIWFDNLQQ